MARFGCFLGVLFIILSMVLLMVVVVLPVLPFGEGEPTLMRVSALIVCAPGEQFVQDFRTQSDLRGTVRGGQVYCVDEAGNQRNVTGDMFMRAMILFLVPFFIGLAFVMSSVSSMTRRAVNGAFQIDTDGGSTGAIRFGGMSIKVNGEELSTNPSTWKAMGTGTAATTEGGDLSARLRELQKTYDEGLITREEYDRLRQQILDRAGGS